MVHNYIVAHSRVGAYYHEHLACDMLGFCWPFLLIAFGAIKLKELFFALLKHIYGYPNRLIEKMKTRKRKQKEGQKEAK